MDEIELLVEETLKHFHENFTAPGPTEEGFTFDAQDELPIGPGLLYHIQKSSLVFVVRTFVSKSIREDYRQIMDHPENYPSLRLLEDAQKGMTERLRFFLVENPYQAEIIHDQLNNRRFPINEEAMCNLSDPGFSWWLTKKPLGFQLSFTLSVGLDEESIKLGPLGDHQLALKSFQDFAEMMSHAELPMNVQNETNRVLFEEAEEFLLEELKDLFEFGVVNNGLRDLFKVLAYKLKDHSTLETTWFYLQELAAMRRFWIQIQYDLNT